jgi:hypothetical protein
VTRGDWLVVVTVIAAALLLAPTASAIVAPDGGSVVLRGPEGVTTVSIEESGRYVVSGHRGDVVFELERGLVRAVSAQCPDQICVHSGAVAPGRPVVCAPNGVSATLLLRRGEGLDAVSR